MPAAVAAGEGEHYGRLFSTPLRLLCWASQRRARMGGKGYPTGGDDRHREVNRRALCPRLEQECYR
jgi:hypothetical protein